MRETSNLKGRSAGRTLAIAALVNLSASVWSACVDARADERVVSIGGAVTEIIYALGRQANVAAVDTTSLFPPEALKTKPNVGYMRALSAEGVLSLKPSMILAAEGAGPPTALASLRESGVMFVTIPDAPTAVGVQRKIVAVGEAMGSREAAQGLAKDVEARFAALAAHRGRIEKPKRVLFILSASGGRTVVGGAGTSADAMIALAGATNAAGAVEGFKPMSDEAIVAAAPDVILTMRREGAGHDRAATPAFALTPAGKAGAFIEMDGNYLLGFGPRAPDAARDVMAALYPDLRLPPLRGANADGGDKP